MKKETTKKILCYALTPQIMPRIKDLFFSSFSYIAFFMAQIYRAARLLPNGHPYLNAANMGDFGVRHVIIEAGHNLVIRRENIDQLIIYVMILSAIALLLIQMLMLGLGIFVQTAHAAGIMPSTFAGYFLLPNTYATHDLAFVLLDRVFGLPDFFVDAGHKPTCVAQGNIECFNIGQSTRKFTPDGTIYTDYARSASTTLDFPWPFHKALHKMFEAYSIGLLFIALFIFIYFVMAIVVETAQTGTPFGKRFNHVWAPLRLVVAIGLLVPLSSGLNSAQYLLMYAAKYGSGFASNGWAMFNDTAIIGGNTLLGKADTLVATPHAPPVNTLIEFASILATCKESYERMYYEKTNRDKVIIDAYLVNGDENLAMDPLKLVEGSDELSFSSALEYFNSGDIIVRFGELRSNEYQTRSGRVVPYCGEVSLQITDVNKAGSPGSYSILEAYYGLIQILWSDAADGASGCPYTSGVWNLGCIGYRVSNRYLTIGHDPSSKLPDSVLLESIRADYQSYVDTVIETGVDKQRASPEWSEQLTKLGWGGAAIWYNKVAQLNGSLVGAAYSLPTVRKYPLIMENIRKKKAAANTDTPGATRHQLYQGPNAPIMLSDAEEKQIGNAMFLIQKLWQDHYAEKKPTGNIYIEAINILFGTAGLFDIHQNSDDGVHPLAQLAAIGRGILDSSIRNLGYSAAAGLGGGIINIFEDHLVGKMALTASGFLSQIAFMGLTIGFVLFYIIPLLPFIYFFFAVGGWIKGIFEAMVGVPLWALAHLRIDGQGLPGDAAMGGYYLILEIFLRPIFIIFGFIASIVIFSAQVKILNEIWPLIVSNTAGFDADAAKNAKVILDPNQVGSLRYVRGSIDKLFFTVIYTIVVYMLAMTSFKMIDLIPNHILRWMGANVSTFGDQSGDPAENMVRNSFMGMNMVTDPLKGAMGSATDSVKGGGDAAKELAAPVKK